MKYNCETNMSRALLSNSAQVKIFLLRWPQLSIYHAMLNERYAYQLPKREKRVIWYCFDNMYDVTGRSVLSVLSIRFLRVDMLVIFYRSEIIVRL